MAVEISASMSIGSGSLAMLPVDVFGICLLVVFGIGIVGAYFKSRQVQRDDGQTRHLRRAEKVAQTRVKEKMEPTRSGRQFLRNTDDAHIVADVAQDAVDQPNGAYVEDLDMLDPHYKKPDTPH